jgi:thiamine-monophosphate kinase
LWVSGSIGDAGAGLKLAAGGRKVRDEAGAALVERYRLPRPRLEAGQRLAPLVSAMMDVSDGLLIDAQRMAAASGRKVTIDLDAIPLSAAYLELAGDDRAARLAAATAGDDYELLFATPPSLGSRMQALAEDVGLPFTRVGRFEAGSGLELRDGKDPVTVPAALGFEHQR